jgi:hypothetical protein
MPQPESSARWCASAIVRAAIPVFLFMAVVLPVRVQAVFSQPVNISNSTGSSGYEQVAVDAFGDIYVVRTHEDSTPPFATTVFFSRSSNGGMAFTSGPAPAGGAMVSLSSSNSGSVSVPSSLTIPQESTIATFRAAANRRGVGGTIEITGASAESHKAPQCSCDVYSVRKDCSQRFRAIRSRRFWWKTNNRLRI